MLLSLRQCASFTKRAARKPDSLPTRSVAHAHETCLQKKIFKHSHFHSGRPSLFKSVPRVNVCRVAITNNGIIKRNVTCYYFYYPYYYHSYYYHDY